MSLLRPFRTLVDPVARNEPWSTTQLPAGVTQPFDIRSPSGSMVVAILPATRDTIGGGNTEQLQRPQLFIPGTLLSIARLDHVSPPPTIASISTGGTNTTGTVRVWISVSPDLRNGAWCEVERTANDDVPDRFFFDTRPAAVVFDEFLQDDGRSDDFGVPAIGFPTFGTVSKVMNRVLRLRYGYTEDGQDTVVNSYRALTTRPAFVLLEIAAQPLDALQFEDSVCPISVFLLVRQSPLDQETDSLSLFSFDCPAALLRQSNDATAERINALQWTHDGGQINDERNVSVSPLYTIDATPLPASTCHLSTVITDGVTFTVPRIAGVAESQSINHQRWSSQFGTWSFLGTPQYNSPDVAERSAFAVKNGPWWHESGIVSPGTSAAIVGARHRLDITMPEWNEGLTQPIVSYGIFSPTRGLSIENDAALVRRVLQGQAFACDPTIGGEQLLQGCYAAQRTLDVIDTQQPGPFDPAITTTDFTLLPFAQVFVRTSAEMQFERRNHRTLNPWAARDEALAAGMPEDAYDYYAKSSSDYFNAIPDGVRLYVQIQITFQWTVTRVQPGGPETLATGYLRRHFSSGGNFLFFLTDEQCVLLANGESLDVPQYLIPPQFGGIPTGYTATMSLSVLS